MTGLLLVNVGTPDAPTPDAVHAYLKQFLMDPYVVDLAFPFRWFLVNRIILRKRHTDSAALYRKIWTDRGSPLRSHLDDLTAAVAAKLPPRDWAVAGGMRYGNPSIEAGLKQLLARGVTELVVFPLYPQLSAAATQSSIVEVRRVLKQLAPKLPVNFIPEFYADDRFLEAFAERIRGELKDYSYDHLLFSYHGLPVRQVRRASPGHCFRSSLPNGDCCATLSGTNRNCYRAQCYETSRRLATKLGLAPDRYTVCFQSRLGRTKWIPPYTDELYRTYAKRGARRLAVVCPAFVADCLETLEEVAIRGREEFLANGGEDLKLVSSLNVSPQWVDAVTSFAERARASRAP